MSRQQRPPVLPVAAFAVCMLLTACASSDQTPPATEVWQQDKKPVMQSIAQLQDAQQKLQTRVDALQQQLVAKMAEDDKRQKAADAALQEQLLQMKTEIRRLRLTTANLQATRKITREKLDRKIEKIAQAIKPAEPVDQSASKEDEKDHYTAAYLALKSGRYDEAIEKFRELLKSYPEGGYSDQAYYWLGESYLAQNNIERAIGNLEWLVSHYPNSTKHAAAMLRLAQAYQTQGRPEDARAMLQQLIKAHTDSPAAEDARRMLQSSAKSSGK